MKRFLVLLLGALAAMAVLAGCGSDPAEVGTGTTPEPIPTTVPVEAEPSPTPTDGVAAPTATPMPDATPTVDPGPAEPTATPTPDPMAGERQALVDARARWQANRPDAYRMIYRLICECDQGPWVVTVAADGTVEADYVDRPPGAGDRIPYLSVEAIFDDIGATLDEGRVPVEVDYDPANGVPTNYIWNGPELPVDGGFILEMTEFTPDPVEPTADEAALAQARSRWAESALADDYDYTFTSVCFCPPEFVGPYEASVRSNEVVAATFEGIDLFDVEVLDIDDYGDAVLTVQQVFDQVESAIADADSFSVEYHPVHGYPIDVFIDWQANIADEEAGYSIDDLRPPGAGIVLAECSADGIDAVLVPQPELPVAIQTQRQRIFDAAVACDVDALSNLTNPDGFTASFGGGSASQVWIDAERAGVPVIRTLVRILNLDYTTIGEEADPIYVWPSAFDQLTAADGSGLTDAQYQALLEIYTVQDLQVMFDGFESYVGYRAGIDAAGNWLFYVAGD